MQKKSIAVAVYIFLFGGTLSLMFVAIQHLAARVKTTEAIVAPQGDNHVCKTRVERARFSENPEAMERMREQQFDAELAALNKRV